MALPITVPFTFANATTTQNLSSLDSDFATVYNAVNGIGNGTVSLSNVNVTGGNISNVTFSGVVASPENGYQRNRIINGAMMIDQRNAGASVTINTLAGSYTVDRWFAAGKASAGVFTVQRLSASAPATFINYLACTTTTSATPGATDAYVIGQFIEGFNVSDLAWGSASAKTITLSFQVYSSLTGTFGGSVANNAANRCYPFSFSIPSANTWTTISVTIPGDTTGTWTTDNTAGVKLYFDLGSGTSLRGTAGSWGSTFYTGVTGATSMIASNGATFYITGVQFEVGSVATPFERRMYGTEFGLCERYYQNAQAANEGYLTGAANASDGVTWHTSMRAAPTIAFSNLAYGGTASGTYNAIFSTISGVGVYSGTTGAGNYYWHVTVVGTAEL